MTLVPATTSRVAEHTAGHINLQIPQQIDANVAYFAEHRTRSIIASTSSIGNGTSSGPWRRTPPVSPCSG